MSSFFGIMTLMPIIFFFFIFFTIIVLLVLAVNKSKKNMKDMSDTTYGQTTEEGSFTDIFKKSFETLEAKIDNENAKYKKVTCPYCGVTSKGTDGKCSNCGAPLQTN